MSHLTRPSFFKASPLLRGRMIGVFLACVYVSAVDAFAGEGGGAAAHSPAFAARDDRVVLPENSPAVSLSVLANDDIDEASLAGLSLKIIGSPKGSAMIATQGTASVADDHISYRPPADQGGEDAFSYAVCEPSGRCTQARVKVIIRPGIDVFESTQTGAGFVDVPLSGLRAMPEMRVDATRLVPARKSQLELPAGDTPASAWDGSGSGTATMLRTVRAEKDALTHGMQILVDGHGTAGDLDLYAGVDLNGNGRPDLAQELICASAMSETAERCELFLPQSQTGSASYWVVAHNRHTSQQVAMLEVFEVPMGPSDGSLVATGPGMVPEGVAFPLRLAWSDAGMLPRESRAGYVVLSSQGKETGRFPFRVDRTSDASAAHVLTEQPLALGLAPGAAQERLFVDVPAGAQTLVVETSSDSNIDLYLAHVSVASSPAIDAAPARAQASASATGASGNERVEVTGAALQPGRWYVTPVNRDIGEARLSIKATIAATAPVVRSGSYFNPERSGHGLFLYPAGPDWVGLWFTYLQDGSPTWYYLQGPLAGVNGVWVGNLYRSRWDGVANTLTQVGEGRVTPSGPDAFQFSYSLDGEMGSEPMVAFGRGCLEGGEVPVDLSAHWYPPSKPGTGYSVQLWPEWSYEFIAAYLYDGLGIARFVVSETDNPYRALGESIPVEQLSGFCPLCERTGAPTRTTVGEALQHVANGQIQVMEMTVNFANGVPGQWRVSHLVELLGGPGSSQGCDP